MRDNASELAATTARSPPSRTSTARDPPAPWRRAWSRAGAAAFPRLRPRATFSCTPGDTMPPNKSTEPPRAEVLLGLGANLGDPRRQLATAVLRLRALVDDVRVSSVY